ncbi:MAG TPA: methyltransferase [Thermomicrobiales bacterium]|nr:methyltransferase [Thermomicrobiales bacterium]
MVADVRAITPDRIMQLGFAYWGSKTLLSAVELGLFTALAAGPLDAEALRGRLGLHPRGARDFFDALVALGMLERQGDQYRNTPETGAFLDRTTAPYSGGFLEMSGARLYGFWGSLTEALRTGQPQNEAKTGGDFFGAIYRDPARLRGFARAMTGISAGAAQAITRQFPWARYRTFADLGTAEGCLPVQVALAHPHLTGVGFDLPPLGPIFDEYAASFGLQHRLRFQGGDFFADPLPQAEVLVLGRVLHDWSVDERRALLARAYAALPAGGALLVYETILDDERRENAFGLLMSLNMLIETPAGGDYTRAECAAWLREAGFRETYAEHLHGPDSMVVGIK